MSRVEGSNAVEQALVTDNSNTQWSNLQKITIAAVVVIGAMGIAYYYSQDTLPPYGWGELRADSEEMRLALEKTIDPLKTCSLDPKNCTFDHVETIFTGFSTALDKMKSSFTNSQGLISENCISDSNCSAFECSLNAPFAFWPHFSSDTQAGVLKSQYGLWKELGRPHYSIEGLVNSTKCKLTTDLHTEACNFANPYPWESGISYTYHAPWAYFTDLKTYLQQVNEIWQDKSGLEEFADLKILVNKVWDQRKELGNILSEGLFDSQWCNKYFVEAVTG